MICAYCSSEIPENVEFCPVCGARQTAGVIHSTQEMADLEKQSVEQTFETAASSDETILSMPGSQPLEQLQADEVEQPQAPSGEYQPTMVGEMPAVESAQPPSQPEVEILESVYSAGETPSLAQSKQGSRAVSIILITCLVLLCCWVILCLLLFGGFVLAFQNIGY